MLAFAHPRRGLLLQGAGLRRVTARAAGVGGVVADDGRPGADLPFRHQAAGHVRVGLANASTTSLDGAEKNRTPRSTGSASAPPEQELAARHRFARVFDVRTAELRPAFEDVRDVCMIGRKCMGQ